MFELVGCLGGPSIQKSRSRSYLPKIIFILIINYLICSVTAASEILDESQSLTPPYFNLAFGRNITATATCGEDTDEGPELYCKLVGANTDTDENISVIQGQVCDHCDPNDPKKNHDASKAIDGIETWWQSPPLSRGSKYNEVNLTIDFGQEFHVAYVFIRMGNSPRPGLWVLEKSTDYGKTFVPWQYFSESVFECERSFGIKATNHILRDNTVICSTEYSQIVPLEGGEIVIPMLKNRPSANNYFNSTELQEWTRATNVRLHFKRTKTLGGHLQSVAEQDPTVTRRYFYSVKDISIGGRCMCNGHADTCHLESKTSNKLICQCVHRTCGAKCSECCPNYVQKKWRQSTSFNPFVCEKCNCFNHATECIYDPEVDRLQQSLDIHGIYDGGGVCQNCQHNTEGINCNKCQPTFYRPYNKHWNETDVCQPCNCDLHYSTGNCAEETGQCECREAFQSPNCDSCSDGYFGYPDCRPCECNKNGTLYNQCESNGENCPCKSNYQGQHCDRCADEYYKFPECLPCECNSRGSQSAACNEQTGNCSCNLNYQGRTCDVCSDGYFNYPDCEVCDCDQQGTVDGVCDKQVGTCICKPGYSGSRCDQCIPGYYGYPNCQPCNCSYVGSVSAVCDETGTCSCLSNFATRSCTECSPGYYDYPQCLYCNCFVQGSNGVSCDDQGNCQCHDNFVGERCDQCQEGFYNFPNCEECNCNPAGVVAAFAGCGSVPAGQLCECKERVEGRICDKCKPLFWNLHPTNPDGCEDCTCNSPGVIGGIKVCDSDSGQCVCKPKVSSKDCNECADGAYNLQESNLFGCTDCNCDIGGSVSSVCAKTSGQCQCHPRIQGKSCDKPAINHYFPTLHQYQYEVEDGRTPGNNKVRIGSSDVDFPEYSWKGYGVFSDLQHEIIMQNIMVHKPSLYRMVLRYVNKNSQDVMGTISIIPDNPSDSNQTFTVVFKPSEVPTFVTVFNSKTSVPSPFVMNPGIWTVSITIKSYLLLDYFVLLPAAFYEATLLTRNILSPCVIGDKSLCRHYSYPDISNYATVHGTGGFTSSGGERTRIREYYGDVNQLQELDESEIPLINNIQVELNFDVTLTRPGAYVLLVNYLTPVDENRTQELQVETSDQQNREKGHVILYACPYTMVCRQVVADREDRIAIFNFNSNNVRIALKGNENSNLGIKSIVFVPIDEWSLDFIQPQSVCVRNEGNCIKSKFPVAPYSKKVQIELGNEDLVANVRPTNIYDNSSQLILLNSEDPMIDISSKVPQPGGYVFAVHFYQPNHPEFNLDVVVHNGRMYEGKLPVHYCPSNSGCRAIVKLPNGDNTFSLTENFVLTLKEPGGKSVWIDYILVIPAESYHEKVLTEDKFDQTRHFIQTCGQNHFAVSTNETGFCRDAVFSLTSAYNNGAKPCQCDFDGSMSFECDVFGGQCPCKPNVIGRKCEICKTGFYGFPDCQPCRCPLSASCEPTTGECTCLPHVIGSNCDKCENFTYGFDISIGCEECKCNPLGVEQGNLQCDLINGNCDCKPNVMGRTCHRCDPGYHKFPYCEECECDIRGTTDDICDLESAECFCKENVDGNACDLCVDGSFNLQENNPLGCSKCFCFGKTTRCRSSDYYKTQIEDMESWIISAISIDEVTKEVNFATLINLPTKKGENRLEVAGIDDSDKFLYLTAPITYLENKLTAYGGLLSYDILYYSQPSGLGEATFAPDIVLRGGDDIVLLHSSFEVPTSGISFGMALELTEQNFLLPNGKEVTREQMLTVLQNLKGIYLRTSYWNQSISTRISDVKMEVGTPQFLSNSTVADSIEQCQCPPNYVGLSCESCAPGYYRIDSGPNGGYCIACNCNGHSSECDVETGICLNCQHNTTGDHCEQCEIGFHGDATNATPNDCLICACPIPLASNNFGTSCDVSADGEWISCQCREGYIGSRCEACSTGYYGKPEELNDYCKPCDCSGNIISEEIGACDTVSGECLKCLNNTSGSACELCRPGYYGDAILQKNCQRCDCDEVGTEYCSNEDGTCHCRPNVIGQKCDTCEENYYGFESGAGCVPCECSIASQSLQCDPISGQCRCQPGVTGRKCDVCSTGYWNYTDIGCITCGCHEDYSGGVGCNQNTGSCDCLPNVKGVKCDHCDHRWIFIPDQGCFESDTCVHGLLDVTDAMQFELDPVVSQFETISTSYFTSQRLNHINNTLNNMRGTVRLLDPNTIESGTEWKGEELHSGALQLNRKIENALENANKSISDAAQFRENASEILNLIQKNLDNVQKTVQDVNDIADRLETGSSVQLDPAIKKSKEILELINVVNFAEQSNYTNEQLNISKNLLAKMVNFSEPTNVQNERVNLLVKQTDDFDSMLNNLTSYASNVVEQADDVEVLNSNNRLSQVRKNVDAASLKHGEIEETLSNSDVLLKNATVYLNAAKNAFNNLSSTELELRRLKNTLNNTYLTNEHDIIDVKNDLIKGNAYKNELVEKAQQLETVVNLPSSVLDAVEAAEAYKTIVHEVELAKNASNLAKICNDNATVLSDGLLDRTNQAEQDSVQVSNQAKDMLNDIQTRLHPKLKDTTKFVESIQAVLDEGKQNLTQIVAAIENNPNKQLLNDTMGRADIAEATAKSTAGLLSDIVDNLPKELVEADKLPKVYDNANEQMKQANEELTNINKILPNLYDLMDKISPNQDLGGNSIEATKSIMDIQDKIAKLNRMIAQARDEVSRVNVAMKFFRNSSLQLKNPPNLQSLSTTTKVSFYFKTGNENGFLFYLGNEIGTNLRRTNSDDFMAIEIQNGFPVLTIDLGNGPTKIIGDTYVADNEWYQIVVERIGKNIRLITNLQRKNEPAQSKIREQKVEGTNTIFNLDQDLSKIVVGGSAAASKLQLQNNDPVFEGTIEELRIGGQEVSLWNFVDGSNIQGDYGRDSLLDSSPGTGYRFGGKGYIKLDSKPYVSPKKFSINLQFKTDAPDGLIFLIGADQSSYLSLEMKNGFIVYQYQLGENQLAIAQTTQLTLNDNKWHTIEASHYYENGRLKVDNIIYNLTSVGPTRDLKLTNEMYLGGYPGHHNFPTVTNIDFDGCIDEVSFDITPVDLSIQLEAFDVTPGCPPKFHGTVSFDKYNPGYLRYPDASSGQEFEITLTFSTLDPDGLIFYATNDIQNDTLSLALVDGNLILKNKETTLSTSSLKLNDGEHYVVTITHDSTQLQIFVNDYEKFVQKQNQKPRKFAYKHIYFGGVPTSIIVPDEVLSSRIPFAGCIEDVTLNGIIINFANVGDKGNVILGTCSTSASVEKPIVQPKLPPQIIAENSNEENTSEIDESLNSITDAPTTTTTARTPATRAPLVPPQHADQCALPLNPEETAGYDSGYRFGTISNSRIEFRENELPLRHKNRINITMEMKSDHPADTLGDAVLFYAADKDHIQFIALLLNQGRIELRFKVGEEVSSIINDRPLNDQKWHTISFMQQHVTGKLSIDNEEPFEETLPGENIPLNVQAPFYLGGTAATVSEFVNQNLGTSTTFAGCIRNIHHNGKKVGEPALISAVPCSENVENGIYFTKEGGYVRLDKKFKVGVQFGVQLEIKPRKNTGIILGVHGKKDYMILTMRDGRITAIANNGEGPFEASFTPNSPHYICDGNWHSVLVLKSKNVVTIAVDNVFGSSGQHGTEKRTDTSHGLFIGGHPYQDRLAGFRTNKESFVGCMRNVLVNDKAINIQEKPAFKGVRYNVCPTN